MDAAQWVTDEFGQIDFGDSRLHKRFLKVTKDFSRQPSMSTSGACCSWADTKAAYRMFDNPKVTPHAILNSHIENVVHRADAFSVVLAVQDTCFLDFKNHKKTAGLGKISNSKHGEPEGLIMHTAYMLSPSGLPLGVNGHRKAAIKGWAFLTQFFLDSAIYIRIMWGADQNKHAEAIHSRDFGQMLSSCVF